MRIVGDVPDSEDFDLWSFKHQSQYVEEMSCLVKGSTVPGLVINIVVVVHKDQDLQTYLNITNNNNNNNNNSTLFQMFLAAFQWSKIKINIQKYKCSIFV